MRSGDGGGACMGVRRQSLMVQTLAVALLLFDLWKALSTGLSAAWLRL